MEKLDVSSAARGEGITSRSDFTQILARGARGAHLRKNRDRKERKREEKGGKCHSRECPYLLKREEPSPKFGGRKLTYPEKGGEKGKGEEEGGMRAGTPPLWKACWKNRPRSWHWENERFMNGESGHWATRKRELNNFGV